jgi:Malectin domain
MKEENCTKWSCTLPRHSKCDPILGPWISLLYLPISLSSFATPSERVFDVIIGQDSTKILAVDLIALAGARTAVTKSVTVAASFFIYISFFGAVNYGLISAIEVHLVGDVPPSQSPIVKPVAPTKRPTQSPVSRLFELFINSGGDGYTDSQGKEWVNDTPYFSAEIGSGSVHSIADRDIVDTADDKIYLSERFGRMFYYEIKVPNVGVYEVVFHFAEIQYVPRCSTCPAFGSRRSKLTQSIGFVSVLLVLVSAPSTLS